jgi:hypothetical protein
VNAGRRPVGEHGTVNISLAPPFPATPPLNVVPVNVAP